jgi:hypothetical protein
VWRFKENEEEEEEEEEEEAEEEGEGEEEGEAEEGDEEAEEEEEEAEGGGEEEEEKKEEDEEEEENENKKKKKKKEEEEEEEEKEKMKKEEEEKKEKEKKKEEKEKEKKEKEEEEEEEEKKKKKNNNNNIRMVAADFIFLASKIYIKRSVLGEANTGQRKILTCTSMPYYTFELLNPMSSAHSERSAGIDTCNKTETFEICRPAKGLGRVQKADTGCRNVSEMLQICCRFVADLSQNTDFLFRFRFVSFGWTRPYEAFACGVVSVDGYGQTCILQKVLLPVRSRTCEGEG